MHPGLLVVLGDDHQLGFAIGLRNRVEGAWQILVRPQDAEPGPRTNPELDAGLVTQHVVLAVAEEGEVVGVRAS